MNLSQKTFFIESDQKSVFCIRKFAFKIGELFTDRIFWRFILQSGVTHMYAPSKCLFAKRPSIKRTDQWNAIISHADVEFGNRKGTRRNGRVFLFYIFTMTDLQLY